MGVANSGSTGVTLRVSGYRMSEVAVQNLRLDSDGRLRLRPSCPSAYPYIYRDASSVRWDESSRELYVLEVPGFDVLT
jgi:hypothetical protein